MRKRTLGWPLGLVAVLAFALVAAGCGGSGSSSNKTTTAGSGATASGLTLPTAMRRKPCETRCSAGGKQKKPAA